MAKIAMTIKQRCDHANLLPTIGSLQQMIESKALKKCLVECFGKAQLEAYEMTNDNGRWSCKETSAEKSTLVTLSDQEVQYFKNFIDSLDRRKSIQIDDVDFYNSILAIQPEEETENKEQ